MEGAFFASVRTAISAAALNHAMTEWTNSAAELDHSMMELNHSTAELVHFAAPLYPSMTSMTAFFMEWKFFIFIRSY
jgi:hypothetical protein